MSEDLGHTASNEEGLHELLRDAAEGLKGIKEQRSVLTAQAREIRERVRASGIDAKELERVVREVELDQEQRRNKDLSYAMCRQALGLPVVDQADLFEQLQPQDEAA